MKLVETLVEKYKEACRKAKFFPKLISAIRNQDIAKINELWDSVEDKNAYLEKSVRDNNLVVSSVRTKILSEAIKTNDLAVFRTCFDLTGGDPNTVMHFECINPYHGWEGEASLLLYAMRDKKDQIAGFLSQHEGLDMSLEHNIAAVQDATEETNMDAVNATLVKRQAELSL